MTRVLFLARARGSGGGGGISSRGRAPSSRRRRLRSASSMIHGGRTRVMAVPSSSREKVEEGEQGERGGGRRSCARPASLRRGTRSLASASASRRPVSRRLGRRTFGVSTPVQLTPQQRAGHLRSVSHLAPPLRGIAVSTPENAGGEVPFHLSRSPSAGRGGLRGDASRGGRGLSNAARARPPSGFR